MRRKAAQIPPGPGTAISNPSHEEARCDFPSSCLQRVGLSGDGTYESGSLLLPEHAVLIAGLVYQIFCHDPDACFAPTATEAHHPPTAQALRHQRRYPKTLMTWARAQHHEAAMIAMRIERKVRWKGELSSVVCSGVSKKDIAASK